MEILNWGTFNEVIYRISPQGNNSLLTGANASGKSTLVDALLTLLVPMKRNRFYNQSSGVEKKGARTEESYVLGVSWHSAGRGGYSFHHHKITSEAPVPSCWHLSAMQKERISRCFKSGISAGQELKAVYGISRMALKIKEDFAEFDVRGEWRKRLDRKITPKRVKESLISTTDHRNMGHKSVSASICVRAMP